MPALQPLRAEHAPALLDFELANRAYFAASIPDRGDDYFARFEERLGELLAWQAEGRDFLHVLVEEGGEVVGRVNLVDAVDGCAELGYRIAERAAGRGLATAGVREVCGLAVARYGLTALRAETTVDNGASRTVLARTGFVTVGEAVVDGRTRIRYRLDLV
ncbi:GNAT family N-acetyltransferase [Streptomyces sp. NBC_01477]|uniref:GNAT family N-acetyltransferase n=1 Tax=Streptomyces sp. NBC_01477 TaxID=2976015 RepID=UPI002E2F5D6A|nr:GNAT family N-acetyltransferase [Streptomyces sp. NBC_01477]